MKKWLGTVAAAAIPAAALLVPLAFSATAAADEIVGPIGLGSGDGGPAAPEVAGADPDSPDPRATALPLPELPLPLGYEIRTLYPAPDGPPVERYTDAVIGVPAAVDADGDAAPDLLSQLTIDAGRATVRFTKLPAAPEAMPLLVEAIVSDPRGTTNLKVAYGYDARSTTAPASFQSTVQLIGAARITSFAMDVETAGAGSSLAVIGEVFEEGPNRERLDPQRGRVRYEPVPNIAHIGLLQGSDFGIQQSGVDLATNTPTFAKVTIEDIQGARNVRSDVVIDTLPNVLSLVLTEADDGRNTWNYQASARVEDLSFTIRETRGEEIVDDFAILLEDMALQAVLIQDTATHATFEATSRIGALSAGSADGRMIAWLDEPAYLHGTDRGTGDSFAFRVVGLRRAELDTGDPFVVDVTMDAGPFHVLIEDGPRTIDGRIEDLPSELRIEFSESAGTIDYEGSAPIERIRVDITDPTGVAGRATALHLAVDDVPTELSFAFGVDGGDARVDAGDGEIGSVKLLMTSGPALEVDPGFDGVVLEDVDTHYALAIRLTGLRLVSISTGGAPYTAELRKASGPFLVDLTEGDRAVRVEVYDLPDVLSAVLDPNGLLAYEGSAPIDEITVVASDPSGLAGRATDLDLRIADVPHALTLDFSTEDVAVVDAHEARIGSIDLLLTSGPVIEVDAGYDGLILEDVDSHYALVARITGLRLASVTTAEPYAIDLRKDAGPFVVRMTEGERFAEVLVHDLPDSLQASFDPAGAFAYTASAPIGEVLVTATDPEGIVGRATALDLDLIGLPAELTFDWATGEEALLDAHGDEIGLIELSLTSSEPVAVPDGFDGIVLRDTDDAYRMAVRLTGLRRTSVTMAEPYALSIEKQAGPFLVDLLQGVRSTEIRVLDLPSTIDVVLDPSGRASYSASAPIGEISLAIDDPSGVSGRATTLEVLLLDLPAELDVSFDASSSEASVDAHGARIGLVELLATSGPRVALPEGYDGILSEDVADHFFVSVRLEGLRFVRVTGEAPFVFEMRKDASPFLVDIKEGQRTLRAEILDLPDDLLATFDPDAGILEWAASAEVDSITVDAADPSGIAGRATVLDLDLAGLPQQLTVTFGASTATAIDAHGSRIGLLRLRLTSGPVLELPAGYDGVLLEDVPSHFAMTAQLTGLRVVSLTNEAPYVLDLRKDEGPFLVDLEQGQRTATIEVLNLPDSLQATLDPAGTASYDASAPISSLKILLEDPDGISGRMTSFRLDVLDLPPSLDLEFGAGTTAGIDANGAQIGFIDLAMTSGPVVSVPEGYEGIVYDDLPSHEALAVRIGGLRRATVSLAAPYELTLQKAPGPFLVHLRQGTRDALVRVHDLPSSVTAVLDPDGTLTYEGSAPIASLEALVTDPSGVAGRATRLELTLTGIPTALTLDFGTGAQAGIDAHGSTLGGVTLFATSGPALDVDPGYEGVVLEDVPSHYAVAARLTGLRVARVTTGSAPYTLTLQKNAGPFLVQLVQGERRTTARIHDLPSSLVATLDPAGSLSYSASAPVGEISAEIVDPAGVTGRATRATVLLRSLPTTLDVGWESSGGTVSADAGGASVGLLEVLLTSGPEATLPADRDGLILEDLADRYVLFGRLTGLRGVSFTQNPPAFDLRTTGGRLFDVALRKGSAQTTALIDRLPAEVSVAFTSSTALRYRASAPVSSIRIDAVDPAGISGRATQLHGTLLNLPVALDAGWSSSGTVTLDALGGTVGLVELQLTSGPDNRLPASVDGLLLEDLSDRYVVFARITGLRRLVGTQAPMPDLTLSTTGGRVLRVDMNELRGGKVQYTRATLTSLPQTVRVRVSGKEMFYDASSTAQSLVLDTNSGDRWNLHAEIGNPVPARLSFCAASDGFCNGYARSSGAGSFKLDASEHTSVNVFDCVRPLNSSCQRGSASEFTQLDNWRVRHFAFDADTSDSGFDGYTFNNTNGHSLQGYLLRIGGSTGFEADIRPGYSSVNRHVRWDWWGLDKDKSGSVNCAGSSFSIRVLGIWLGVTSYVC